MSSRIAVVEVARDSPESPLRTLPGVAQNRSQTLSPRPSSCAAPSIWYDAVAAPQRKSGGTVLCLGIVSSRSVRGAVTWQRAACRGRASTRCGVIWEQTSIASGHARGSGSLRWVDRRRRSRPVGARSAAPRSSSPDPARRRAAGACTGGAARRGRPRSARARRSAPAYMTRMSSAT
jgi:hypothetical protein